ncbi:hypothetical protein ACFV2X_38475 [Streptomyces sp. NPDC059679]|uniref:hypothetical protein n=1 Tax=Streptomyces sp. NPDC059679 TaxID=3346903 RepID=UPI0036940E41
MAMTAAEHFEKAEALLEKADNYCNDDRVPIWLTRAHAHLAAARLLLDAEISMVDPGSPPGTAAWRSGMDQIAEKRRTT